ncbi:site-specific integrase [Shewanella halifaxensis]|uniref:site-specific integrase n=1 Tax=Shewanella halifaxensis TaxID=271098 RepID=UPI0013A67BD6|nr:site-specific integrase [Shewanella halifaxensis]
MHNLHLSRHGIWYFRKVTIAPNGKRKEVKRSLGTRDKTLAKTKVLQLLACLKSNHSKAQVVEPLATPAVEAIDFHASLKAYLEYKSGTVSIREVTSITRSCMRYLAYTATPLSKKAASSFMDTLEMSPVTKNKYADKIGSFFKWVAARTDEVIRNPFEGIRYKHAKSASEQRAAYTRTELAKLFSITKTLPMHKQWIIKIAAYSGMRATEIVQLSSDDIKQVDGIWCIDINDSKEWQSLKNKNSRRVIPMHKELEPFVLYAKARVGRVFPEFKYNEGFPCARYFSNWFSTFRKREGLPEFHSLRHYVASVFKSAGVPMQYAAAMLGHSNSSITYDRYGKGISPAHLVELLPHLK